MRNIDGTPPCLSDILSLSAHVLLNLLNELGQKIRCEAFIRLYSEGKKVQETTRLTPLKILFHSLFRLLQTEDERIFPETSKNNKKKKKKTEAHGPQWLTWVNSYKIKFMSFERSELGINSLSFATATSTFVYSNVRGYEMQMYKRNSSFKCDSYIDEHRKKLAACFLTWNLYR